MVKVEGLNELSQYIAYEEIVRNHIKTAERKAKQARVKQLIASGVDKEVAKVMASVGL